MKEAFGFAPSWHLWLRYSTFLVLYPTGISSEVGLIYFALPYIKASEKYCFRMPNKWNFSFDYFYAAILALGIYVPVLTCTIICSDRGRGHFPNQKRSELFSRFAALWLLSPNFGACISSRVSIFLAEYDDGVGAAAEFTKICCELGNSELRGEAGEWRTEQPANMAMANCGSTTWVRMGCGGRGNSHIGCGQRGRRVDSDVRDGVLQRPHDASTTVEVISYRWVSSPPPPILLYYFKEVWNRSGIACRLLVIPNGYRAVDVNEGADPDSVLPTERLAAQGL
ncbi:hypothetical protein Godav_027755 [Gossypium davidsonii]|uniref:Very-long-chain (3R)-3-hydroxyacyl-CoA dehydratase n=1 Tax=Gossypium davidsonii TaxID=34287 RepID=A0A7J8RWX8_GOSDV|nr:hypothetical protein [Gossypium davidsonii]